MRCRNFHGGGHSFGHAHVIFVTLWLRIRSWCLLVIYIVCSNDQPLHGVCKSITFWDTHTHTHWHMRCCFIFRVPRWSIFSCGWVQCQQIGLQHPRASSFDPISMFVGQWFFHFKTPSLIWLVVWNMNFLFPYIGNVIIPTDELIFVQRGRYTTNQPSLMFETQCLLYCVGGLPILPRGIPDGRHWRRDQNHRPISGNGSLPSGFWT